MIILCVRAAFCNVHIGAVDVARVIRGKEGHGVGDPNAICPAGCSVAGLMTSIASPPAETTRAPSIWIGM
jgi:hypothetical protein